MNNVILQAHQDPDGLNKMQKRKLKMLKKSFSFELFLCIFFIDLFVSRTFHAALFFYWFLARFCLVFSFFVFLLLLLFFLVLAFLFLVCKNKVAFNYSQKITNHAIARVKFLEAFCF